MRWQDIVISLCQTGFIFALIPSLRSRSKPAVATSISYVVMLSAIGTSLLTLELWLSAATAYAGVVPWLILAVQKYKQK